MMTQAEANALRATATRIKLEAWWSASEPMQMAAAVLMLLDERDNGRRMAEERFDAEMAELRDGLVQLRQAIDTGHVLLETRVNGVARRVDALEAPQADA